MNIRDLHQQEMDGQEPPSAEIHAGEYVLGVLDAEQRQDAKRRIERDSGFARLVTDWEHRLAPWIDTRETAEVAVHVWPRVRTRLGWASIDAASQARPGLWQNTGFWRAATGLALAATVAAIAVGPLGLFPVDGTVKPEPIVVEPTPPAPPIGDPAATKPVTTLIRDDGSPGWLASVDAADGTVLIVPVPAPADDRGRVPELWLIPPGESPKSLGILPNDRSRTVEVPDALRQSLAKGALLAITLEPAGGAPNGVPSGPIVAKGDIVTL